MWSNEARKGAHKKLKQKLGSKKYREFMADIGAKGGKASVPKGFSITKKQLDEVRRTARPEFDGTGHIPEEKA